MAIIESKQSQREGFMVYWTVNDADHTRLHDGLPVNLRCTLAPRRSLHTAIKATLDRLFPNRRGHAPVLVRPLSGRSGYEVVRERRGAERNAYESLCSVRVETVDGEETPTVRWWNPASEYADRNTIVREIAHERKLLGRHKVARVLALTVEAARGVPLRDRGSIYWLPPSGLDMFRQAAGAVDGACPDGSSIHVVRMILDADGCKAVSEAVTADVLEGVAKLSDGLDGKPDHNVIRQKSADAKRLRQRMAEYEGLLGAPLKAVRDSLAKVERVLIVSQLSAAAKSA
jgi:hypothetical protein